MSFILRYINLHLGGVPCHNFIPLLFKTLHITNSFETNKPMPLTIPVSPSCNKDFAQMHDPNKMIIDYKSFVVWVAKNLLKKISFNVFTIFIHLYSLLPSLCVYFHVSPSPSLSTPFSLHSRTSINRH
ncbi:hypothetical protein AAZV13_07G173500 [Glycine max]